MLYRPLYLVTMSSVALVLLACLLMIGTGMRGFERFASATRQLEQLSQFELEVRSALVDEAADAGSPEDALRQLDSRRIAQASQRRDELVTGFQPQASQASINQAQRVELLQSMADRARLEWWLTVALGAVLSVGVVVLWWQFRRRVLRPLATLNELLTTMARRRYELAETTCIHPALRPLFASYNDLVTRVVDSESEQQRREGALRRELNEATRAMLQQQHALTRSERMAATGELAAQLAHDIRNPLAGILAAVENLRRDSEDEDHRKRLSLVAEEVSRLTRQINDLVDAASQRPEATREVRLSTCVGSLITLVGYQLPDNMEISADVADDLRVTLPEGGLRQALLNLVLNSAKAIGDAGGRIGVDARREEGVVVITVRDDGPGFSEQALASGVRSFASYRSGGTGLGLAAARRFAADLGGDMSISNLDNGGACVMLRLLASEHDA